MNSAPEHCHLDFEIRAVAERKSQTDRARSEEHTSELQSPYDLVCRLLLEKKKKKKKKKKIKKKKKTKKKKKIKNEKTKKKKKYKYDKIYTKIQNEHQECGLKET